MKKVIVRYPDVALDGDTIVISGPPRCLFHYREELAEYADQQERQVATTHIEFALDYMEVTFASDIHHFIPTACSTAPQKALSTMNGCGWLIVLERSYIARRINMP